MGRLRKTVDASASDDEIDDEFAIVKDCDVVVNDGDDEMLIDDSDDDRAAKDLKQDSDDEDGVDGVASDDAHSDEEEEESEAGGCIVCGSNENTALILLCDGCDAEYHTFCLDPPLQRVPKDKWFCHLCSSGGDSYPVLGPNDFNTPLQEKQIDLMLARKEGKQQRSFLVKFVRRSYREAKWLTMAEVVALGGERKAINFSKRLDAGEQDDDLPEGHDFNPDYTVVERVVMARGSPKHGRPIYLVKWQGLGYDECTWEEEQGLRNDHERIKDFHRREQTAMKRLEDNALEGDVWDLEDSLGSQPGLVGKDVIEQLVWKGGNTLREHQVEGVCWLLHSWLQKRSVILGDEMGLGKTVQITALFNILTTKYQNPGPYLVVLPLSTIGHWRREMEAWTDLNVVTLMGIKAARDVVVAYEFFKGARKRGKHPKFHVILTTFEMLNKECSRLKSFEWQCLVVDEGHRMKSKESLCAKNLISIKSKHRVILTGTPIQNHVGELFMLLHFLDPKTFKSQEKFMSKYGNMQDTDTLKDLHEILQPRLLRRMKEDVMKDIPLKTETLIKAKMTRMQKMNYKAILERNFQFLCQGITKKANIPKLSDVSWSLRQVCNHPLLLHGATERLTGNEDQWPPMADMVKASAKLLLVDKLLKKWNAEGAKVLIFSQMLDMLDILEEYLAEQSYLYERLDGSTAARDRQQAIDRFNNPTMGRFVFLLSTRAGGVGINLTSANTVVIFDSDWNPQNDIQAQARCHRIGQQDNVKVYRLITEGSYEEKMFEVASQKIGLDKAVLAGAGDWQGQQTNQDLSAEQLSTMLKNGVYALYGDQDAEEFEETDIDKILAKAETRTVGGPSSEEKAGGLGTFAKAVFTTNEGQTVDLDDAFFWEKILPKKATASELLRQIEAGETLQEAKGRAKFLDDLEACAANNSKSIAELRIIKEVSPPPLRRAETLERVEGARRFKHNVPQSHASE